MTTFKRVRIAPRDVEIATAIMADLDLMDLQDVAEAIVQAIELDGRDRDEAHVIAAWATKRRDELLALH